MKKLLILPILLILFCFTSCDDQSIVSKRYLTNPFLVKKDLGTSLSNTLKFSAITDVHINREDRDNGVVALNPQLEVYKKYLSDNNPEFIINLGDHFDEGKNDYPDFELNLTYYNDIPMIFTAGNHDVVKTMIEDETIMNTSKFYAEPMEAYSYTAENGKKLSIYKLDNSRRVFGRKQLTWLDEALKQDDADYILFIQHIPLTSHISDQSIFWFCISDMGERNSMMRIMSLYNVNLLMVGHHHIGNLVTDLNDKINEFILSAFHRKEKLFPTNGYFYDCTFSFETGKLDINAFLSQKGEPDNISYSFDL